MQAAGFILCSLVGLRLIQAIVKELKVQSVADDVSAKSMLLLDQKILATKALTSQRQQDHLHWNGYRKFRVGKKVQEANGISSLYLIPHDGKPLPRYRPGQYLTFRFQVPLTADSAQQASASQAGDRQQHSQPSPQLKSVVRCYSLSDAPQEDCFRVTVKRVLPVLGSDHPPGVVSNYVQDSVKAGDLLDVQAPRGDFALDPNGTHPVVLVGGGVGVTPVLSMLNAIVMAESSREVWFFYAVRNGDDQIMKQHLTNLADTWPNVHLFVCYSEPLETDRLGIDFHDSGHLNVDKIRDVVKVCNFDFYVCGPPAMMDSLVPALVDWGVAKDRIHSEAFGPATVKAVPKSQPISRPAESDSASQDAATATVHFSRSNQKVAWDGTADNLLDLADHHGIQIDSGCRAGSCGTCIVAIKKGKTETTIDADGGCDEGSCLACVSTPVGDLVLDA
ncbi:MAG: 2Fe-2S iron-sulfur cluster-binding protein [Fuerstiella sp.]